MWHRSPTTICYRCSDFKYLLLFRGLGIVICFQMQYLHNESDIVQTWPETHRSHTHPPFCRCNVSSSIRVRLQCSHSSPGVEHFPAFTLLSETPACSPGGGLLCLSVQAPHQGLAHSGHGEHTEADLLQLVEDHAGGVVHVVLRTTEVERRKHT